MRAFSEMIARQADQVGIIYTKITMEVVQKGTIWASWCGEVGLMLGYSERIGRPCSPQHPQCRDKGSSRSFASCLISA